MAINTKTNWINILHFYQPPTIERETLRSAAAESYVPLLNFLKENPNCRLTININSCLVYLLKENGYEQWIKELALLLNSGQLELMDTAAFHPVLPLLKEAEIYKQIKINQKMNQELLRPNNRPRGFWLPECAYSKKVAEIIKSCGYHWIVLDEISATGREQSIDPEILYEIARVGLKVIFRNRKISRSFVPDTMLKLLTDQQLPATVVTATDGELYGHRHKDFELTLKKIIVNQQIKTQTVSEYLQTLAAKQPCDPVDSNWDADENELRRGLPYFLWYNPQNKIQMLLWKLADRAYDLVEKREGQEDYWWARLHLERGLSSCTFWWLSGKDFRLFAPPAWKPDEVEKGANELIRAIRSLAIDKKTKIKAEKLYFKIKRNLWLKHWKKYA